jgi:hypothetical protein
LTSRAIQELVPTKEEERAGTSTSYLMRISAFMDLERRILPLLRRGRM